MNHQSKIARGLSRAQAAGQSRQAANDCIAAKAPTLKLEISPGHRYAWGTQYSQQEIKDALTPTQQPQQ